MNHRLKIVLGLFVVVGIAAVALKPRAYSDRTEEWMESVVPEQVPGFTLLSSSRTDESVRMSDVVYDVLQPFGITTRYFQGEDGRTYELVVLAGNTRKSFHDPRVCFTAQSWDIGEPGVYKINVPELGGDVDVSAMVMKNVATGSEASAMFFYKTPFGIRPDTLRVPFDLTFAKLMLKENVDAQFYRFMVIPPSDGDDVLQKDLKALEQFARSVFGELQKGEEGKYFTLAP